MVNAPEGLNLAILRKVRFDLPKMFFLCIPAVLLNFTVFSNFIMDLELSGNIQNNSEPVDANGPKDP